MYSIECPVGSHNHASIGVFIAESRGGLHLERAGTCKRRSLRILQNIPHVSRWGLLIVRSRRVRVLNDVVWYVRPQISLFSRSMPDTMQHLVGVHISNDGELAQFRLHLHLRHSFHAFHSFLHSSLAPFAIHLHFYLHRLNINYKIKKKKLKYEN